jgi:DNA-binding SARP family transcriptional activator
LWEGPDDPRASLRWSLAKLRPLLGEHLVAGRERVELMADGASIDIRELCTPASATTATLEACAARFRGEFLDALDLPSCFRFQQWCIAERDRYRQSQIAILAELTRRLGDAALPYARQRVLIDPFNEEAHAALVRSLTSSGQSHEALRHYDHCKSLFERELGTRPGALIEDARRAIGRTTAKAAPAPEAAASKTTFVGREAELDAIRASTQPLLLLGEPGIGKSRLLDELRHSTRGVTIYARAFAAEMVRPYGLWIDALGSLPVEQDRSQLFDAVAKSLEDAALIAVDDVQWIDESSAALLHYLIRSSKAKIVCAARVGEIDDNRHAKQLARSLHSMRLGPMSVDDLRELVSDERAVTASGGNPLYAIELSMRGADDAAPLQKIITERLAGLEDSAREIVSWAAAIGRQFSAETVGRATSMPAGEMIAALDRLERLAVIRPAGDRTYDFAHDLIRDAAYQLISGPRRTLVHRHIARALRETHDADGALAGEILHHASLAGDHEIAARAAVEAGQRCLRLFAFEEAFAVARRGMQMTTDIALQMQLLHVALTARVPASEKVGFIPRIVELIESARVSGDAKTASLGATILAPLYEETNRHSAALGMSMKMAELSRTADPVTAAVSMANAARCLIVLHRDIDQAEALLAQARAIGVDTTEFPLALGFLDAHRGRTADAIPHLEQAFDAASREQDHWREWCALHRLATLALEEEEATVALRHCERLRAVAEKMKGGSEAVRAEVLEMLARSMAGERVDITVALDLLRSVDSKSDLAWALCLVASRESDAERRRTYATEAMEAAEAVQRVSESAIARSILGLPIKPSRDISARARRFMKEIRHGRSRTRANV